MDSKAVAVLESYGWEKGKGLGRNETGAVESIKVVRKSNTKGLGKQGNHWGNDWWDRMYSSALNNCGENKKESTVVTKIEETQKEELVYGYFTKSTTLNTLNESDSEKEEIESSDEEYQEDPLEIERKSKAIHHMDDNSVFAACNNIIMRKYVPVGKLERIAEQERQWKLKSQSNGECVEQEETLVIHQVTSTVGKKRKLDRGNVDEPPKKKKKKEKSQDKKSKKKSKKSKEEKKKKNDKDVKKKKKSKEDKKKKKEKESKKKEKK